ncbi:DUF565 domain-containing protein [Calothrix sp. 336/3]|uniref:DUF565 domain-containing protein n=1 Tax=Calothrix sp. 336/3 TaxID=1337936 RepID=UPI0004E4300C|nr:DUF565 domain-containing protein [Calothrix sp. 336/3]AKG22970.1 hypothetical protein IJ00_18300 [Calothrix sp. 336/3]
MQNTRLNTLVTTVSERVGQWIFNPWRRISLLIISFLLGFFLGTVVATSAGQKAELDIVVAATLVIISEIGSKIYYRLWYNQQPPPWAECLNLLKVGFTYSLFIEACKLGS